MKKQDQGYFEKGLEYLNNGEYTKAIDCFIMAEKFSQNGHPYASHNKGNVYYIIQEYTKALDSWTKAEKDSSVGLPKSSYNKGAVYVELGQFSNALISYTKAEVDSPCGLPEASYNKGSIYKNIGNYEKALDSWTKAEVDSQEGFPDASHNKGDLYKDMEEYEKALLAWTKAENDSSGGYPKASINKGVLYKNIGENILALKSLSKAEADTPGGNVQASYYKGIIYDDTGEKRKALASYTKAENDAPAGYPQASFNKGVIYNEMGIYKKAIASWTKAEEDSPEGYPIASYNKGLIYNKMGLTSKALTSWTKVEEDSPNGYPVASYNKGILYSDKGELENALISWTKTEEDAPDGFPDASNNKGTIYLALEQFENALVSFTKAEEDSLNGHPMASLNKGAVFDKIGEVNNALNSWTKAEEDSPTGYPLASYNKGISYYYLDLDLSIESFNKAIHDSENNFFPLCNLWLSKCHYTKSNHELAQNFAFQALQESDREYEIVEHVRDYHSTKETEKFYTSRMEYLVLALEDEIKKLYRKEFHTEKKIFIQALAKISTPMDFQELFHHLLRKNEVVFPVPISHKERLRLSYLIHFQKGNYHNVFHTLDVDMDNLYELEDIDHYFYFISAYFIGEPVFELRSFLDYLSKSERNSNVKLAEWSSKIEKAIHKKCYLDTFLLDISLPNNFIGEDVSLLKGHHEWIMDVLGVIRENSNSYELPLSENVLLGMLPQLLVNLRIDVTEAITFPAHKWDNIKNSLRNSHHKEEFNYLIMNIREGIRLGVPYTMILLNVMDVFNREEDTRQKHNLLLVQAAVLFSERIDNKREVPIRDKMVIDAIIGLSTEGLFHLLDITAFGLGTALSILMSISQHMIGKNRQERVKYIFDSLLTQVK